MEHATSRAKGLRGSLHAAGTLPLTLFYPLATSKHSTLNRILTLQRVVLPIVANHTGTLLIKKSNQLIMVTVSISLSLSGIKSLVAVPNGAPRPVCQRPNTASNRLSRVPAVTVSGHKGDT